MRLWAASPASAAIALAAAAAAISLPAAAGVAVGTALGIYGPPMASHPDFQCHHVDEGQDESCILLVYCNHLECNTPQAACQH